MYTYEYNVVFLEKPVASGSGDCFVGSLKWDVSINKGDFLSFEEEGPLVTADRGERGMPQWAKHRLWEVVRVQHTLDGEHQGKAISLVAQ